MRLERAVAEQMAGLGGRGVVRIALLATLTALLSVFPSPSRAAPPAPPEPVDSGFWPVMTELPPPTLRLSLRAQPAEPQFGDEVVLVFEVTNVGESEYLQDDAGEDERAEGFRVQVTTADGRPVRPAFGIGLGGGVSGGPRPLAPGASFEARLSMNKIALILGPGEYRVHGSYAPASWRLETRGPGGRRLPIQGKRLSAIEAPELRVVIAPRTPGEMTRHIERLGQNLAVGLRDGGRPNATAGRMRGYCCDRIVQSLAYTRDPRVIPALIDWMYEQEGGGTTAASLAFLRYLPAPESKRALLEAAGRRGLVGGMTNLLTWLGVTKEEMVPFIERSLAPDSPATWHEGAFAALGAEDFDRFNDRVVAIARDRSSPARRQALAALICHRTDEGVKTLQEALVDPEIRRDVAQMIVGTRRDPTRGRPLLESDFDQAALKELAR
jgi:hypothetical protein